MKQHIMMHNLGLQDINPLICGTHDCPPGHGGRGPAAREYYLLHYIFTGKGLFESPRGKYQLRAGQIFIIRPQEICTYTADSSEPWSYAWVGFECRFSLVDILQDVLTVPGAAYIFQALADAVHIEAGREWYICGKVYELLALLETTASPRRDNAAGWR